MGAAKDKVKIDTVKFLQRLVFTPCHQHGHMLALEGYVTEDFHKWLLRVVCANRTSDHWYQRKTGVNPFFQGGSIYEGDGWIFIEFWTKDVAAASAYCDLICLEYYTQLTGETND